VAGCDASSANANESASDVRAAVADREMRRTFMNGLPDPSRRVFVVQVLSPV
jgi:hypothetical protein